MKPQHKDS